MSDYEIALHRIHIQHQVQGSVIVMHEEMCSVTHQEWLKKCKEEGEFLGSVLFHTLPEETRHYMGVMIRRLEEM